MEAEQTMRAWAGSLAASEALSLRSAVTMRWRAYLTVLAVACLPLGVLWDTSWHISIGRDTFWAPPHIVIQLGGVIPALLFAWQGANITFRGTAEERAASVCFWGAHAPFGAWVTM